MQHQHNADEIGYIVYFELSHAYTEVTRDEIELLANGVGEGLFESTEGIIYFVKVLKNMLVRLKVFATWSNEYPIPEVSNKKRTSAAAVDERSSLVNLLVDLSKKVFIQWKLYTGVHDFDDLYS